VGVLIRVGDDLHWSTVGGGWGTRAEDEPSPTRAARPATPHPDGPTSCSPGSRRCVHGADRSPRQANRHSDPRRSCPALPVQKSSLAISIKGTNRLRHPLPRQSRRTKVNGCAKARVGSPRPGAAGRQLGKSWNFMRASVRRAGPQGSIHEPNAALNHRNSTLPGPCAASADPAPPLGTHPGIPTPAYRPQGTVPAPGNRPRTRPQGPAPGLSPEPDPGPRQGCRRCLSRP